MKIFIKFFNSIFTLMLYYISFSTILNVHRLSQSFAANKKFYYNLFNFQNKFALSNKIIPKLNTFDRLSMWHRDYETDTATYNYSF